MFVPKKKKKKVIGNLNKLIVNKIMSVILN